MDEDGSLRHKVLVETYGVSTALSEQRTSGMTHAVLVIQGLGGLAWLSSGVAVHAAGKKLLKVRITLEDFLGGDVQGKSHPRCVQGLVLTLDFCLVQWKSCRTFTSTRSATSASNTTDAPSFRAVGTTRGPPSCCCPHDICPWRRFRRARSHPRPDSACGGELQSRLFHGHQQRAFPPDK